MVRHQKENTMENLINQMINPEPLPKDKARRRRVWASTAILASVAIGGTALTTGALFTDTQGADGSGFTTGTVDLATSPASVIVSSDNLAPGDTVTGPVTVQNTGSLEYRYSVTDLATNVDGLGLHTQLQLAVYAVPDAAQCTKDGTATLTPLGTKAGVALADELLLGNSTQGQDAGDRIVPAGGADLLCVRVDLPLATTNEFQSATSEIRFTFNAEQTANN
jgi:spore coat-associated protein N